MKRLSPVGLLLSLLACGGGGGGSTPTTPAPTTTTLTLAGTITESAPTTGTRIPGALVIIVDGPNAGRSTNSDGSGNYSLTGLTRGGFTVGFRADGYQDAVRPVTLTENISLTVPLAPTPRVIITDRADTLSGGDAICTGSGIPEPCKTVTLDIHNNGTMAATLQWDDSSTDLDLALYRGSTLIAESRSASGRLEIITSTVTGGSVYVLLVTYYRGSRITPFRVHVAHPN